jgi:hypothetical protein
MYLCLINQALRNKDVRGSECIDPSFLDLCTSWSWVVSFKIRPIYSQEKSPRYTLNRLGGPRSRSGRRGEMKILAPTGTPISDPFVVQPVASRYTDWAIPAPLYAETENL